MHRLFLATAAIVLLPLVAAGSATPQASGPVYVIPIHGDIEASTLVFARRQTQAALDSGASAIVYDLDTFGGRVDSALRISSFIGSVRSVPTIAWVRSGPDSLGVSWSAGALIALSCSRIYMAPGTSIGAAAPVVAGPEGTMAAAGEKTVSAVRSQMAALAEKNGHPAGIALAMVDEDVELLEVELDGAIRALTRQETESIETRGDRRLRRIGTISAQGKLLSLTAGEAERYGLSSGTAVDLVELSALVGTQAEVVELSRSLSDSVVAFLTSGAVQAILVLIGIVALFLEINTPGFGIPGTVAIVAFLVLFGSNALLGTVGSLELVVFLVGLALLAVEIFVLPGFGVTGISGIVLIGASLVLSMQDFVVPTFDWEWTLLGRNVLTVFTGILAAIAGIGGLVLAGPKLRMFDRLALTTVISDTASGTPLPPEGTRPEAGDPGKPGIEAPPAHPFVGRVGTSVTVLRPSGRIELDGQVYGAESDGTYIEAGSRVRVLMVQGNRIVVRAVPGDAGQTEGKE